jgi:4-phosphopantoate--beta-alanine ligase
VLGDEPDAKLDGLDHARALCSREGIFMSDVVLVPLEDGDRCQALKASGKNVITIDLNPMSRTAQAADITIVDNLIRAMPNLIRTLEGYKKKMELEILTREKLENELASFSNSEVLEYIQKRMVERFS